MAEMIPYLQDKPTNENLEEIWRWNSTVPEAIEKCVHDLFVEQAKAQPNASAVCAWDGELTYGELDELSSKLAAHLVQLGVKREDVVPLCFEKSMWTVVAMLAVLKAGGAFVPLDPDHPASRHLEMFKQTGAQVVLTSSQHAMLFASLVRHQVTVSKASTNQLDAAVMHITHSLVQPTDAAYVMFTSGSSGIPKGVVLEHRAVSTSCLGHGRAFGIKNTTRVLQFASYVFTDSIVEIITTLVYGGCICVPSDSDRRNDLARTINAFNVNWAILTSTVARLLDPNEIPSLNILVIGGEQVYSADWNRWSSSIEIINGYGQTECCAICTRHVGKQEFESCTIGTSIASVSWVVDPENHHRLMPLGSIGELLVEGPILARGYLNDAKKTAEAFIDDPAWLLEGFEGHAGRRGRLYKTGDLVRYNSDGSLVCLGRKDRQVKVGGRRIELGEVEHHARECLPEAKQLAVELILPSGERDRALLAAFVRLQDDTRNALLGNGEAKSNVIGPVVLQSKTDRKRLQEIGASFTAQQIANMQTSSQGPKRQPSTEAEQTMQQLWAQVLRIEPDSIGLDDSFFRLGGDSIAAMKLVGEARRMGLQLSVADVFQHPKLAALAGQDTKQCSNTAEEVSAFSLLGEDVDAAQIREEVATICNVDASIVEDVYPCSPLQEGLMSLTAKRAGDYIMQDVLELQADVDEHAFRAAWEQVAQLTAALRTRIVQQSELGLLQVVVKEKMQWTESKSMEEYLNEDKAASMGLGDRLARYALIKESCGGKRWFVWTIHHALYDGWSLPLVLDAVKQVYSGAALERQPSFNTFIQYVSQQDVKAAAAYWQTALADCEAVLFPPLPSTVTQPVADTTVKYQCPPSPEVTSSNITTSTLIRAAWAIIASRYTSSEDIVFGTTVTGRNAPITGVEAMVGPTIATVPLRVRPRKGQTVSAFLENLQQQATEMIAYEQTGLQRIMKMGPGPQHACGFQTLLVVHPTDDVLSSDDTLGEWHSRSDSELQYFTTYALTIQCTLAVEGVQITASFDARVVEHWVVEKMLGQFSFVMQQLAEAGVEKKVADIETTTLEDRQQLWVWNADMPPAVDRCIHDLFAEQARARPDASAVCAWDGELTYGELDELSSKLAAHLVQLGVKREDVVPLCFEKSMWTVVAMLAVLKAGGAFVPLDPGHPASRHEEIFKQIGAQVVLTSSQHAMLFASSERHQVTVSKVSTSQLPTVVNFAKSPVDPGNTAYIIFTSGTTGIPKGVVLQHRAVTTSCLGHGEAFGYTDHARVLQFASYTFDACIAEIITTLLYGGCICVPSESDRRNNLAKAISTMDVNCALLTPSVARLLEPSAVPSLKRLVLQGEQVSFADWNRWPGSVQTINGYGPTECSVCCNTYSGKQGFKSGIIGTSVASLSWVVDAGNHNRLAPLGSIGELLVEGPILARGYLNDIDKTEAAFIDDPAWLLEGYEGHAGRRGRLYKTGDLVRCDADGNLVCLGRKDSQVKVRGQRVELGEIEHHVRECLPEARQLAVEVILPSGQKEHALLAAFIQLDKGNHNALFEEKASGEDSMAQVVFLTGVEEELAKRLPEHMVPTILFTVKAMPITTSGKIDRKRLQDIGASFTVQQLAEMRTSSQGPKRQPSTEVEQTMQQLWAQVLSIEPNSIGLDDSFFRLGGDSIVAMKLVGEARRTGLQLSVADIFRHPRLVDLARVQNSQFSSAAEEVPAFSLLGEDVNAVQLSQDAAAMCSVAAGIVEDIYPCSPLQEGLMSLTAKRAGDYIMQSVLELRIDVDEDVFRAAWEHIVRSTAVLRTRIVQHSELGLLQVVIEENIQWTEPKSLEEYLSEDKAVSVGLGDPLARYAFVKEACGGKRWFVWTIHHAVYDGWSLPLILHAVKQVYSGGVLQWQPSFNAFIQYLGQQDLEATVAYWQTALADCEAVLFPTLPPTVTQPVADATVEYQCPPLSKATSDTTTSTLIRAAWAIVTSRYTTSDDVVFGTTVTGRNTPVTGVEAMVGPTIATVPVRLRVQRDQTVFAFLQGLQQQATDMIAHEQTGLQRIAKMGQGPQHACSFQTLLVVQPVDDVLDNTLGEWRDHSELQEFTTYTLMLQCMLAAEGVQITASFDTRVIEKWVVEKMLRQFSFIMQQLAEAGVEKKVADIETTTPEDRQQLWAWNQNVPPAVERCIHDLFTEQAAARPDAPAVCAWDGELTYGELDALASKLAGYLVRLGVKAEDVVPLCFEKSMWTVVAMLAVLKAGGAFLLLDPSLPTERLAVMCRKLGSVHALASEACLPAMTDLVREAVVVVDRKSLLQMPTPDRGLPSTLSTSTAYVIFTSGSTGEPKGCKIEHRSSCTAIVQHGPSVQISTSTRALQFGSYSFAGALAEILYSLIHGGCVCVPSEEERRVGLASAMSRMAVNWAFLTPTVVDGIGELEAVPSLATLCIGGESIRNSQLQKWGDHVHLRQTYGSSETSGYVSSVRLTSGSTTKDVGKGSTAVYWIVDADNHNQLAPLGATGELLVEGAILGRGYTDEAEKTAATFIEVPVWRSSFGKSNFRLYKTGDLARYKNDGSIELLGRKDTQVKLRGQRIELGEIEHQARLSAAVGVKGLAVELIRPKDKNNMLVCFMAIENKPGGQEETGDEAWSAAYAQAAAQTVRDRLERFLPQYMVPALFVPLAQLPTTSSQKVDRKRLREMGASFTAQQLAEMRTSSQGPKRQPSTETERTMQQLWARVLGIEPDSIGLDDSFFRLGGDSIAAMKLVGEARRMGLQLSVADIFRHPKFAALANVQTTQYSSGIEEVLAFSLLGEDADVAQVREEVTAMCSVDASLIEDIYPCSPLQEGLMSLTAKRAGDYIMQTVLELQADVDDNAFCAAWEQVVQLAAVLRTRIVQHNKLGLLQVVVEGKMQWTEAQALEEYLKEDKAVSMGLGDPLARYALIKEACGGKRWFAWTIHHALYDGWSLPLILHAVKQVYSGGVLQRQPSFNAFIQYLSQQDHKAAISYWQTALADCEAVLFPPLPSTVTQPVADTTVEYQCPPLSQSATDITTSTLVRAAWAIVTSRYTSSDDVVFGATVTGRNAPVTSIDAMLAPTIATVPVRVRVQGDQATCVFLKSLQDQATEMIAHEQSGLQRIAKMGQGPQHACGFQTLLVVQPTDDVLRSDDMFGEWRSYSEMQEFTTYALMVQCTLSKDSVEVTASFDVRVIEQWVAEKMLRQFSFIMQQLAEASEYSKVADIDTTTPEDRQQLWAWNQNVPAAIERCIHDLFAEQARARPDAPAIAAWDGELTYGELDALSSKLAGHLVQLGVKAEDVVPLCFEKSMWTVVAMLAVLKAGGAFLLLDPSLPKERLKSMCT
ncbi:Non-ribosomal peptide synthetase [Pyrenophora teres f. maculata]|nr:Non-ribosomal peptide synthetase [Pyrenophora teres f. maculata]